MIETEDEVLRKSEISCLPESIVYKWKESDIDNFHTSLKHALITTDTQDYVTVVKGVFKVP